MKGDQTAIPCTLMRGGTSRGAYFLKQDLPVDKATRDNVLLAVMGGPDALQIDGIGGGHPLTNKVAVISGSLRDDAEVDYLFLQVVPNQAIVTSTQNCGNLLAGVGPFAVNNELVAATGEETVVRVHMLNSGDHCELTVPTVNGFAASAGDTQLSGVPGSGAPIVCDFLDVAGSVTGRMLPTGNARDEIEGIDVTCIDNGMPVVIIRAADLNCSGTELPEQLENDDDLKRQLESIRLAAGAAMGLGDVGVKSVPKVCLVSAPRADGHIATRTFIPHACHKSIGVLGAVSVATACLIEGNVAGEIVEVPEGECKTMRIEHPSGSTEVRLQVRNGADPDLLVRRAGIIRTARTLMQGVVFVPKKVWAGSD